MLHINLICVGKLKESYFKDAFAEYQKRLSKYCRFSVTEIPDEKIPENLNDSLIAEIKQKECKKILENLKKGTYVISLDLTGNQYSSEDFSKKIEALSLHQISSITFIIGGSLGLNEEVLSFSNEKICFSKMTFPHQLIRIFLIEQLFRSFKISKGETYHR